MRESLQRRRDYYAGGLMMLIGLFAAVVGRSYQVGTLLHMGPGFMPTALGVILVLLGIMIAGAAAALGDSAEHTPLPAPEWRGWGCIIAGPLLFMILGRYGGLIPATFACVFASALGDRTATLKGSLILAGVITVAGVIVFSYGLKITFPLLVWGGL